MNSFLQHADNVWIQRICIFLMAIISVEYFPHWGYSVAIIILGVILAISNYVEGLKNNTLHE